MFAQTITSANHSSILSPTLQKGYNDMLATEEAPAWEKAPEATDEEKAVDAATKEENMVLMRQKKKDAEKEKELTFSIQV